LKLEIVSNMSPSRVLVVLSDGNFGGVSALDHALLASRDLNRSANGAYRYVKDVCDRDSDNDQKVVSCAEYDSGL
jgi:hypothetical protein